jgi:hypothetical protein
MFRSAIAAKGAAMRRPFIFLLPVLLGQCVDGSMPAIMTPAVNQRISIESSPVTLDASRPERRRIGPLTLIGGWQLTSTTRSFGGFSALDIDGNRVTALGDGGTIVRFRLGRFGNASDASLTRVPEGCGRVTRKYDNDTESLTHDGARRHWWVGFEWRNAICRINSDFSVGEAVAAPPSMAKWRRKQGPESMVRLDDGRFLVMAEGSADDGDIRPVVLFDRDPTDPSAIATRLGYRSPPGYKPTDAAQLPDGRIIVLNRRFDLWSLFTSRLVLLDRPAPAPSGVLQGRVIATFESPVIADNFEGLSITQENGRPVLWMISDDNFIRWQRTLLLKFAVN